MVFGKFVSLVGFFHVFISYFCGVKTRNGIHMNKTRCLLIAASLLMAGCGSVKYTSTGAYLGTLHEVESDLKVVGLMPVGSGRETVNEPYVFDDEWKNDWVVYDTRRFADSLGNTASFTVRYRSIGDGLTNVDVSTCDVSHPDMYAYVCGDDGVVQRLNNMVENKSISNKNVGAALSVLGICISVPFLLGLLVVL